MATIGIITARMGSTRFPGKPLAPILGKPMIQWVWERVSGCQSLDGVHIATDSEDIARAASKFGAMVVVTSPFCRNGTERVLEAAEMLYFHPDDYIINIQGDEPTIHPDTVDAVANTSDRGLSCVTSVYELRDHDDLSRFDPNVVKVVTTANNYALYFSRSPIPSSPMVFVVIWKKHTGVYGYRMDLLRLLGDRTKPLSYLEVLEELEQLRWMENGWARVRMVGSIHKTVSVNTPEDILEAEKFLEEE